MKRIISLMLSLVIILSLVCGAVPSVSAASAMKTSDMAVNMIRSFESFSKWPYLDNGQWTVGYGTGVTGDALSYYNTYGITEAQAAKLLTEYLEGFEKSVNSFIDKNGLKLTQRQFDALVCFTYNLGASWMNDSTGTLYKAVVSGATGNDLIFAMAQFGKASGVVVGGLVERRLCEANLYLNGIYSTLPPVNYKYVVYETNLEDTVPTVSIQGYDTSKGAAVKATASKSGYRFLGWYTKAEGGEPVTSLGTKTASVSALYAHWQNGDGEKNTDGTIKGIAAEYSGYMPANADKKIYKAPGGAEVATVDGDDKLSVVAEYMDSTGVKWGQIKEGWIKVDKGLASAPVYEAPESVIDPITVTVTTNNVNNRVGPGTSYASQGKFAKGQQLTLTAVQKGGSYTWGKSEQGWIALNYTNYDIVRLGDSAEAKKVTAVGTVIKTNVLNVRSGPGVNNTRVAVYYLGDEVKITLRQKIGNTTWGLTEKGWVSMYYIKATDVEAGSVPDIEVSTGGADSPVSGGTVGTNGDGTTVIATGRVVNCTTLRIRAAAGTSNACVGNYKKGAYVNIYETSIVGADKWGRTDKGWVSLRYVELDAPTSGEGVTGRVYNCINLNVRAGAGTTYAKVGKIPSGTKIEILEYTKIGNVTWGRTYLGWVSLYYVKLDAPVTNLDKTPAVDSDTNTGTETTPTEPTPTEPAATKYDVTIGTTTNGTVAVSTESAAKGTVVTLSATPYAGFELDTVTVKDASNNTISVTDNKFTMPGSKVTITATFKAQAAKYSVTINSAKNGKTTASTTSCVAGTEVILTAAPNAGYELESLSVLNTTTNTTVAVSGGKFIMPAGNVNVVATYKAAAANTYTVTVNSITNGTITANTTAAKEGDTVTLTVNPASGYELDELSIKNATTNAAIAVSGTGNTRTFTMPASNVTIAASFKIVQYNVAISASTNGSVSVNPDKYAKGATVTLSVAPDAGYELDTLTVKDASNSVVGTSGNKFTMPASNVTVAATFKKATYTVSVGTSANGSVTCDPTSAKMGEAIALTIKPATGYELDTLAVKDASGNAVAVADNKFNMPASNVTVSATFKASKYDVVITTPTNGALSVNPDKYAMGETVTLVVTPAAGYALDKLTVKDAADKDVTVANNKFTMPASKVTVTATFKAVRKIGVTVTDANGKAVEGVSVTLKKGGSDAIEGMPTLKTNSSGTATFTTEAFKNVTKRMDLVPVITGDYTVEECTAVLALAGVLEPEPGSGLYWLHVCVEEDEPIEGSISLVVKAAE